MGIAKNAEQNLTPKNHADTTHLFGGFYAKDAISMFRDHDRTSKTLSENDSKVTEGTNASHSHYCYLPRIKTKPTNSSLFSLFTNLYMSE